MLDKPSEMLAWCVFLPQKEVKRNGESEDFVPLKSKESLGKT